MTKREQERSVALGTRGTAVTLVQLRLAPHGDCRTAVVESRNPADLRVGDDVVSFTYFDRVSGRYETSDGTPGHFVCEAANQSGVFFLDARRIDDSCVLGRDGRIYCIRPGLDRIITPLKLIVCRLFDGTTRVVSADAVSRGNPGKKMLEKLSRKTVYYQVISQLCGNDPVPLTPRIYIRGVNCGNIRGGAGKVPATVCERIDGRLDMEIVGLVQTSDDGNVTCWGVYEDDIVQLPEPAATELPTGWAKVPDPIEPGTTMGNEPPTAD